MASGFRTASRQRSRFRFLKSRSGPLLMTPATLQRPMVFDRIGIEIHAFHCSPCPSVVIGADRVIQQKLGLTFGSIDFERNHARQISRHYEYRANGGREKSLLRCRTECSVQVVRRSLTILLVFLFAMQLGPACGFATVVMPDSMQCCQTTCPSHSSQRPAGCCQVSATSDKAVAQAAAAPSVAMWSGSVGSAVSALNPVHGIRLLSYRSPAPPPQSALDLLCSRQL